MIKRTAKNETNSTQIDNDLINNGSLSCGAKGVLIYLLSKNDSRKFTKQEIADHFSEGYTPIRNRIKELEDKGYVLITKTRIDGKFTYVWDIFENPTLNN